MGATLNSIEELLKKQQLGVRDSRGMVGILSRGKNVYRGGVPNAHSGGGPQYGRPSNDAVLRRLKRWQR
jgi:hypothetical protein